MAQDLSSVVSKELLGVCEEIGKQEIAKKFYMAGGTGLAMQIQHRRSLDIDLFQIGNEEKIPLRSIENGMIKAFGRHHLKPMVRLVDQVTWEVHGIQVTFCAYPFPLLYQLQDGMKIDRRLAGLRLADPREIALMKAYAIGRRTTFRDYLDLYYVLQRGIATLESITDEASRKFVVQGDRVFSGRLFLEQIAYLEDLEDIETSLKLLVEPVTTQEIAGFLGQKVEQYTSIEERL